MDDRDFPLTMNKPPRHEFEISCPCEPCKAIVERQMKCAHSMIGRSPICVHCGCTEVNRSKYDEMMATAFPWGGMGLKSGQGMPFVPHRSVQSCGCAFDAGGNQTFWCKQHSGKSAVNVRIPHQYQPVPSPAPSSMPCGCVIDPVSGAKLYTCTQCLAAANAQAGAASGNAPPVDPVKVL